VKLIVGLGNPGARYERTRHNLGFIVIDRIAAQNRIVLGQRLCDALMGEGTIEGESVMLAKPQTYMNQSGQAVGALLRACAIATDDLVVINDDLDLPFGRIRVRPSGSAGGHRGLSSIGEELAGAQFLRVRVGIGRPPEGRDATDYVLEAFTAPELEQLSDIIARAADSIGCLLRDGVDRTMAIYNRA
jgi:peptidyl-tRNA hydrolase, PTH1 family